MSTVSIPIDSNLLLAVEREYCTNYFYEFLKSYWSTIIKEKLVLNWHIKYLCDELQDLSYYIVNRLEKPYDMVINIPPGTTKSTIVTVMFPVWLWVQDSTLRAITNSNNASLSIEHATKSRDIIQSDKFREMFPEIQLRQDKSAKSAYENTDTGARYSTSTGASIIGKHAHVIINDDPSDTTQANSEADREAANEHTKALATRKVDKKNTPTIVVMQRLHENDVTGYLLSKKEEEIKHICLPAELSDKVKPAKLKKFYKDGLLDPIRLDREVLHEALKDLGSYGYSNQFEQDSAPPEGGLIKKAWFDIIDWDKEHEALVWHTAVDSAYTKDLKNDESGMLQFAINNNEIVIRYAQEVFEEFPELVKYTITFAKSHGYGSQSMIYVEPKASGKSLVQQIKRTTSYNIKDDDNPFKDKVSRVQDVTPIIESGRVSLIKGSWNDTFLSQVKTFPKGKRKGLIDCLVIACNKIKKPRGQWGKSRTV